MKKTAIEWLVQKTPNMHWEDGYWAHIFEQAKEIEMQQIIDARVTAPLLNTCSKDEYIIEAEQYYKETFNK